MQKLFAIFLCFFILSACSSSGKYPDWYLNPPKNNANFIYGTGEGFDKDEAVYSALSDVAARLKTNISSKTESAFDSDSLGSSSSFAKKINAQSAKMAFKNYEIENIIENKKTGTFLAIVKINTQKFINQNKEEIAKNLEIISNLTQSDLQEGLLAKRKKLLKAAESAILIENLSDILKSVDDSYKSVSNSISLNIYNALNSVNSNLMVEVVCDDELIKSSISRILSKQGIYFKNSANVKIVVKTNWIENEISGGKFVKLNMSISSIDSDGKTISTKSILANGNSVVSFDLAKQSVSSKLEKIIDENDGLF